MKIMIKTSLIIIALFILTACPPDLPEIGNPPVADAGADVTVETGVLVLLSAEKSFDVDENELSFSWTFSSVPGRSKLSAFHIMGASMVSAGFTPDVDGEYIVELKVYDGEFYSTDEVKITAKTTVPTANAGSDKSTVVDSACSLEGSASFDPDGDPLTFSWSLSSCPENCDESTMVISNSRQAVASFTPTVLGLYEFNLTVSDGKNSDVDKVTINVLVTINPPVVDAGDDQEVETGYSVDLDGSGSFDADGDELYYLWTFQNVPASSLLVNDDIQNSTNALSEFTPDTDGDYILKLTVNDGGLIDHDFVTIFAQTGFLRPTADAGADVTVETDYQTDVLDGQASVDPNGDALSYAWSLINSPAGSGLTTVDIVERTSPNMMFTPDVDGEFEFELSVSDGVYSHSDNVVVTAQTGYFRPTAVIGEDVSTDYGQEMVLDASASTDPNGDSLTYYWNVDSRPGGSSAQLSEVNISQPEFTPDVIGEYTVSCTVSDGTYSDVDTMIITATPIYSAGDRIVLQAGTVDIPMRYVPEGLVFPIEINDTSTYGNSDPLSDEYQPAYWVAETEATNELVVTVLNWALNNGLLSEATLTAAEFSLDGQILIDLIDSNCLIGYDGSTFVLKQQSVPNPEISSISVDTQVSIDARTDYLGGASQDSIDVSQYPCSEITWFGAVMFSNWLTEMVVGADEVVYSHPDNDWQFDETVFDDTRKGFRLPESMEWECAARYIGTDVPVGNTNYVEVNGLYWTDGRSPSGGDNHVADYTLSSHPAYTDPMLNVGWYLQNAHESDMNGNTSNHLVFHGEAGERDETGALIEPYLGGYQIGTFTVAQKQPNSLGIYDMSGNVWEICFTQHPVQDTDIIRRGGGFPSHYMFLQVGRILDSLPTYSEHLHGFRLFMTAGG